MMKKFAVAAILTAVLTATSAQAQFRIGGWRAGNIVYGSPSYYYNPGYYGGYSTYSSPSYYDGSVVGSTVYSNPSTSYYADPGVMTYSTPGVTTYSTPAVTTYSTAPVYYYNSYPALGWGGTQYYYGRGWRRWR